MSSIDTITHVGLGYLTVNKLCVPVYWPLGVYEHDEFEEVATSSHWCLGGGSGEHPCLIVSHEAALVWLAHQVEVPAKGNQKELSFLDSLEENPEIRDFLKEYEGWYCYAQINSHHWPLSSWKKCSDRYNFEYKDLLTLVAYTLLKNFSWELSSDKKIKVLASALLELFDKHPTAEISFAGSFKPLKSLLEEENCHFEPAQKEKGAWGRYYDPEAKEVVWGLSISDLREMKRKYENKEKTAESLDCRIADLFSKLI